METKMPVNRDFMNNIVGETETEGRIISTNNGGEAVVFEIPFGIFKLVAIANIPAEGEEYAPVYLKMKIGDNMFRRGVISNQRQLAKRKNYEANTENESDVPVQQYA
jgi:hypothetical protein